MRSIWQSKTHLKSPARPLSQKHFFNKSLDLSKEVQWVFVGQTATKLQAVKVGGLKKILQLGQPRTIHMRLGFESRTMESFSNLKMDYNFAAFWRTETHFEKI